jgi:hypothetical protein
MHLHGGFGRDFCRKRSGDSDIRPSSDEPRGPQRRRADTARMFHARVLSIAVAPPAPPARRPAATAKPAPRRLAHWLGLRRRAR